jgi:type III pantothenate kinase
MLLAIDIGNTNVHFGLWNGGRWCCTWRARTVRSKMGDEYAGLLRSFFNGEGYTFSQVEALVMASVVPDLTSDFVELSERYFKVSPLNIGPGVKTGVRLVFDNPHEVGPDRIVNAAAVQALYGGPAIVVDFGTSTNFDVVNADGDFVGGVLAAGIGLSHDALVSRAARLHKVDLTAPPTTIGKNTVHAMQSGLFLGHVAMIEGICRRITAELLAEDPGQTVKVIGTGGLAPLFAEHTDVIELIAPNLTLEGLRIIWEMNR